MNISSMNSVQHAEYLRHPGLVMVPGHVGKNPGNGYKRIALALIGALAFTPVARADLPPDLEVFSNMQEVPDGELSHMRGKFASNNQVLYFGVEMVSQWQTPTGNIVTAGANLNIDFRGGSGQPSVQYSPTVSIVQQGQGVATVQASNANGVSGGAGLANVSGVSQSIQVAGQSNKIQNGIDMQVDLTSSQGGGLIPSAVQGQAGAVSATGDDGTVAMVTLSNNSIGVNVIVPGQGQVLQTIRDQGMFQSARIGGDLNQIHNTITMHVGINTAAGMGGVGSAYTALQGIKGLPLNGMF